MKAEDPRVYEVLEALHIGFDRFDHPPVATVAAAEQYWHEIDAMHCKNLFLRNRRGDRHYLVVVEHHRAVDLGALTQQIGTDRLSFASPARLAAHLGLEPGAVSPFGLINDATHTVDVIIDAQLKQAAFVAFHPNVNTTTLRLTLIDFVRFLEWTGHPVRWVHF